MEKFGMQQKSIHSNECRNCIKLPRILVSLIVILIINIRIDESNSISRKTINAEQQTDSSLQHLAVHAWVLGAASSLSWKC